MLHVAFMCMATCSMLPPALAKRARFSCHRNCRFLVGKVVGFTFVIISKNTLGWILRCYLRKDKLQDSYKVLTTLNPTNY